MSDQVAAYFEGRPESLVIFRALVVRTVDDAESRWLADLIALAYDYGGG